MSRQARTGTRQFRIPEPAPITDRDTQGGRGLLPVDLIGEVVRIVYEIPDSDRDEVLIGFESGRTICISTDPQYRESFGQGIGPRDTGLWEVVLYDQEDTEAEKKLRELKGGHWL